MKWLSVKSKEDFTSRNEAIKIFLRKFPSDN
uniref:Transposase n=1 Tax=Heterorhabditis bacteriophora TaxID=37862 RepID=A0A1I7WC94_HETBA